MKKYLIPALLLMHIACAVAQQLPGVSYYMYDYTRTNPGSFGSTDMININGIYKTTMIGMPGKPTDIFAEADMPFSLFGLKHGAGVSFYQDVIGFYKDIDLRLGYAIRFTAGDGTIGVGLSGDIHQKELNPTWIGDGLGTDPSNDDNIPKGTGDGNVKGFGLSIGVFYRTEDIYFGASAVNIYHTAFEYSNTSGAGAAATSTPSEKLNPHYYVTAGYNVALSNPAFEFQPSVNAFSDGVAVTFDLNGTLTYNKKLWTGVSYRAGSAVIGMVGITVMEGLRVGFAYDFQTSSLNKYSFGSTEILANYSFKLRKEKVPQRYKSIRYL